MPYKKHRITISRSKPFQLSPEGLQNPVAMFVYGTLRKADPRAIALIHGVLYDVGVAVADRVGDETAGEILGELWYCDRSWMLGILDRYEGYPHSYGRTRVQCVAPAGVEAWVYTAGPWRKDTLTEDDLLPTPACWRKERYIRKLEGTRALIREDLLNDRRTD